MQGTNRVLVPMKENYEPVEGRTVNSRETIIPSDAYQVGGIYYEWNDEGFTGKSFFTDIINGPTNSYGFNSDADVIDYLNSLPEGQRNLNAVFLNWQNFINGLSDDDAWEYSRNFEDAVYNAGGTGCVHY